jgi:hypothetical protein
VDGGGGRLRRKDGADVRDRLEVRYDVATPVCGEHVGLVCGAGVAEHELDHEAIELRLRQRVGALVLNRVLGRDDYERTGELVNLLVERDLALLHALEQAGLGLR